MPILGTMIAVTAGAFMGSSALGFSYSETIDGDLSGDRLAPTVLGVAASGSNTLTATSVAGDREYYTFTVPAGAELTALMLTAYAGDNIAFTAIQAGTQFTEPPSGTNVANLLGYTHFGPATAASPGTDILDNLGAGAGAIGFTPPLPSGDYVFWTQEIGAVADTYTFDFVVSEPPPPACVGDLNDDGATNVSDFSIFASNFGTSGHDPFTNGDFDGDGDVDVFDFGEFASDFGCVEE